MNQKLLSICIPTYNRAHYLKQCIDSLICQFDDVSVYSHTEIVISDNASSDNTGELIKDYQKKYTNIKYFRNQVNLGFDDNVLKVVEKASGRYCWLFGDDDIFEKNSIATIINLISKYNNVEYIFVNAAIHDANLNSLNILHAKNKNIIYINSADEFILDYNLPAFISSQIFIKDLWNSIEKNKYRGNWWIHTSVILEFLSKSNNILYVGTPLIKMRQSSWLIDNQGHSFETFISLKKVINNLLNFGYRTETIAECNRGLARDFPITIIMAKINNRKFKMADLSSIYCNFHFSPIFCFLSLIIYCIPNDFYKGVAFLKHKLEGKNDTRNVP